MKSGKRVLIITDSVGMPRPEVGYEHTWIYRLKQKFPGYDIMDRSARGSTSHRLVTEGGGGVDLLETYMPDIVIMQLGITECAPRLFRKQGPEFFVMNRIMNNDMRARYISFIKKKRVRDPRLTDVSPEIFRQNIRNYFSRAEESGSQVIVLLIARPGELVLGKSPHIKENIDLYNRIFSEEAVPFDNVMLVEPFGEDDDLDRLFLDELHLTPEGYGIIYDRLVPLL